MTIRWHRQRRGRARAVIERLHRERFDVPITDHGLPGMDCAGIARHARARQPSPGIVVATGHDWPAPGQDGPLPRAILPRRPRDKATLAAAVRQAAHVAGYRKPWHRPGPPPDRRTGILAIAQVVRVSAMRRRRRTTRARARSARRHGR